MLAHGFLLLFVENLTYILVRLARISVVWVSTYAAFVALSHISPIFMHEHGVLLSVRRRCDPNWWPSSSKITWTISKRGKVSNLRHSWNVGVSMIAHRLIMAELRRRLLQEMRIIHSSARQDLMALIQTNVAHLLLVDSVHLLVVAAGFGLVAEETGHIAAHFEKGRTFVRDAVIHIVGVHFTRVASVELGLQVSAWLREMGLVVGGMTWSSMQVFIASLVSS